MQKPRNRGWKLETRLLLITGCIVAAVLVASAWISATSAVRVIENEITIRSREEADQLAHQLSGMEEDNLPKEFRSMMVELLELVPGITRVDVFVWDGETLSTLITSSPLGFRNPEEQEENLFLTENAGSFEKETGPKRRLFTVQPFRFRDGSRGCITLVNSLSAVDSIFNAHARIGLFSMLVSIIGLVAAMGVVFRKTVHTQIQHLVDVMNRFRNGDSSARAEEFLSSEFQVISSNLNYLLEQIQELTVNMQLKIDEATEDLASRNRQLEELNLQLAESQSRLSQAERLALVGQLTASVAHEVGSPLGAVSTHLQLLLEEKDLPIEVMDRLRIANNEIDRVSGVVHNLLSTTRTRRERKPVCIDDAIRHVAALLGPIFSSRQVTFEFKNTAQPVWVNGDWDQLEQLFLNLFNNGLDAIRNSGNISVKINRIPESNPKKVLLEICDSGTGISSEQLASIFEPFYSSKKANQGTGLGLVISQEIIRSHGGSITVESQLGLGTRFKVLLPESDAETNINFEGG